MTPPDKSLRFYQNGRCTTELGGPVTRSVFQHTGGLLAQRTGGAEASLSLMAVDFSNTVMMALEHAGNAQYRYTPYGQRPDTGDSKQPLGFNGEQLDLTTGCYLLGNYRLLSPVLQRMCSVDSASPFEKGGLNAYAYCLGDPINNVDPTGRFALKLLSSRVTLGVMAAVTIATSVASVFVKDQTAKDALYLASSLSLGLGAGVFINVMRRQPSPNIFSRVFGSLAAPAPAALAPALNPTGPENSHFSFGSTIQFRSPESPTNQVFELPRVTLTTNGPDGPTARYVPPREANRSVRQ